MKVAKWLTCLTAILSVELCFAQDGIDRELLIKIDPERKAELQSRFALTLARAEYFAMPGKVDVYEINYAVLKLRGETITVTPFDGPSLEFLSNGITVSTQSGGNVARWAGVLSVPGSTRKSSEILALIVKEATSDGRFVRPDPPPGFSSVSSQQEAFSLLEEFYERRGRRLVYGIVGSEFHNPGTIANLRINRLANDSEELFTAVVVIEIDEDKRLWSGTDMPSLDYDPDSRYEVERRRRVSEYERYMEQVRQRLGLPAKTH